MIGDWWCGGFPECTKTTYNHKKGEWEWDDLTVKPRQVVMFHWHRDVVTKPGIRAFAWAAAGTALWSDSGIEPSLITYQRLRQAIFYVREANIRIPASAWEHQRALLRAQLAADYSVDHSPREPTWVRIVRKKALRLARNRR